MRRLGRPYKSQLRPVQISDDSFGYVTLNALTPQLPALAVWREYVALQPWGVNIANLILQRLGFQVDGMHVRHLTPQGLDSIT